SRHVPLMLCCNILFLPILLVSLFLLFLCLFSTNPSLSVIYTLYLHDALPILPTIYLKYRDEIKTISKINWVLAAISGLFLALHFILWFESLNLTSVASSVVLVTLQPIFAFLGTYFFCGERRSVAAAVSLIIKLFGSVI